MTKRILAILTVFILLSFGCTGQQGPSGSQGPPGPKGDSNTQGEIEVRTVTLASGISVGGSGDVIGSGFIPGEVATLELRYPAAGASKVWTSLATVNDWGAFNVRLDLPSDIVVGVYTLRVSVGGKVRATAPVRVSVAPTPAPAPKPSPAPPPK